MTQRDAAPHALPRTMRAAVYRGPRELEIEERPLPELGPREVLIEVSHCGICGTDLHLVLEGMGRPDSIGGHEYSGHVVARGDGVADTWRVGDRVVGGMSPPCGKCEYCVTRRSASLCAERGGFDQKRPFQGAFAGYKRLHESELHRVPEGVSMREAALTEPLAVALHAISLSGIQPGQRALVTGFGPIGALVLAALLAKGVRDVAVSEPAPTRQARARDLGAGRVVSPDDLHVPRMPYELVDGAVDVVFECSGNPRAMEAGLTQLKRMGRLVFVGTGMRRPKLDVNRIILNELSVTGAYNYDWNGFGDALELLASGRLQTGLLIEPRDVPLADLFETLERLAAGEIGGKVMIVPQ